jgi:hypothetical protein
MNVNHNEIEARIQKCVEYRKRPDASLVGWIEIIKNEYGKSRPVANSDYAEAGKRLNEMKELEKQAFLNSMEVQLSNIHKEALDGIVQIKKDNQNTKKLSLSLISQLQDQLSQQPDKLSELVPHLTKLIDTINKTNQNETEVIRIMGRWNDLEKVQQNQVNIQNNAVESIKIEIKKGKEV